MPKSRSLICPNHETPSILYASPLPLPLLQPGMAYYLLPVQIADPVERPKPQLKHFPRPR